MAGLEAAIGNIKVLIQAVCKYRLFYFNFHDLHFWRVVNKVLRIHKVVINYVVFLKLIKGTKLKPLNQVMHGIVRLLEDTAHLQAQKSLLFGVVGVVLDYCC